MEVTSLQGSLTIPNMTRKAESSRQHSSGEKRGQGQGEMHTKVLFTGLLMHGWVQNGLLEIPTPTQPGMPDAHGQGKETLAIEVRAPLAHPWLTHGPAASLASSSTFTFKLANTCPKGE